MKCSLPETRRVSLHDRVVFNASMRPGVVGYFEKRKVTIAGFACG